MSKLRFLEPENVSRKCAKKAIGPLAWVFSAYFDILGTILGHKNRNFGRIDPKSSQFSWKLLKFLILAKNTRPTRKLRFLGPENDSKMQK